MQNSDRQPGLETEPQIGELRPENRARFGTSAVDTTMAVNSGIILETEAPDYVSRHIRPPNNLTSVAESVLCRVGSLTAILPSAAAQRVQRRLALELSFPG